LTQDFFGNLRFKKVISAEDQTPRLSCLFFRVIPLFAICVPFHKRFQAKPVYLDNYAIIINLQMQLDDVKHFWQYIGEKYGHRVTLCVDRSYRGKPYEALVREMIVTKGLKRD
jgi:hypothetical protein